jgi:hypothetical protein
MLRHHPIRVLTILAAIGGKTMTMSTSLLSSIMQFVTPDLIAKIASALGLDRSVTQKAIAAGIPAILASLASLASKPGGPQQLASALALQKSGGVNDVINALGGAGQAARSEEGADMLSGLLGGGGLNALTSAIGSYTGMSSGKSETLLGLLGPMVMGALGQQQRTMGLDAGGVAALLGSQKDLIAAALPSGFAAQLRDSGFLDTLDASFRRSTEAASHVARRAGDMGDAAIAASRQAAPSRTATWPYWLAGLAILAGLGWYILPGEDTTQVAQQAPSPAVPSETVGRATPGQTAMELAGQLSRSVDGMRSALLSISDTASAQAALPKLQQMTAELDKLESAKAQLSPQARSLIASQAAQITPAFNQLCDRVLAIPGVASVAKPLIDSMRSKLDTMSRA